MHVVDDDLIDLLDSSICPAQRLMYREEPLPPHHPFWTHPKIVMYPHAAAWTLPDQRRLIADNIRRTRTGQQCIERLTPGSY